MTLALLSLATFLSTLGGGLMALRLQHRLHYLLSFTAGVLLGLVAFDVVPEIFELAHAHALDAGRAMIALVLGFLLFHSLEKFVLVHHAHEHDYAAHRHPKVGMLSAFALVGHSLMDGIGMGLAFQVSTEVGIAVAIAVVAHDFADGLNTVGLMLTHRSTRRGAFAMLVLDALAPIAGAASTLLVSVPPGGLMIYLGFFAGFLLYIGVSDILPEAHSRAGPGRALGLIGLTCLGSALMLFVARVA